MSTKIAITTKAQLRGAVSKEWQQAPRLGNVRVVLSKGFQVMAVALTTTASMNTSRNWPTIMLLHKNAQVKWSKLLLHKSCKNSHRSRFSKKSSPRLSTSLI